MNKDQIFIYHIQGHLGPGQEVVCKICGKTAKEIIESSGGDKVDQRKLLHDTIAAGFSGQAAPSPAPTIKKDLTVAPLPAEVEEAMDTLRVFGMSGASETGDIPASEREILAALAIIQAALRPKVVSREWVVAMAEVERLKEDCDRTADVVVEQMEELDKLKAELDEEKGRSASLGREIDRLRAAPKLREGKK